MFAWPDSGTALLQALLTLGFVVKPQEGIELRQHLHVDDHGLVSFEGMHPEIFLGGICPSICCEIDQH